VQDALEAIDTQFGLENTTLYFQPEFPDVTIFADGADNKGTLESFYDNTNDRGYYNWTTTQTGTANDINIQFHFKLPTDFVGSPSLTMQYRSQTAVPGENDVEVEIFDVTGGMVSCEADTDNNSANTWATATLNTFGGGCTLTAGDVVLVSMKLIADGDIAGAFADVGAIEFTYSND
jgi:hypothetical protein